MVAEAAYDSQVDTARCVRAGGQRSRSRASPITYVGIDAHNVESHVALLASDGSAPGTWTVRKEARAVDRLRRKPEKIAPGAVACCYEAGRCGYASWRQSDRGRVRGAVIAPALLPRKPGERIKADRRESRKLAEDALRALCRAGDDARVD